jgi:phage N-6-adenine-methyltransferase
MRVPDPRRGSWSTPDWVYQPLNRLLYFDLDVAADANNAKCRRFYTKEMNALRLTWDGRSVWHQPPYGQDPGTGEWMGYALEQVLRLRNRITSLIPVKADTRWYHDLVWGSNRVQTSAILRGPLPGRWYQLRERWGFVELLELRGRIPFGGAKGGGFIASAVVLFNAGRRPVIPELERMAA